MISQSPVPGEAEQFIRLPEVPRVTYIGPDGRADTVCIALGDTLLDGALDNNIPGILGQCGGGCTCSTCHCYIEAPWFAKLPAPHPDERALLAYAEDPRPSSRLACQIKLSDDLDGLTVRLPERQLPERDNGG